MTAPYGMKFNKKIKPVLTANGEINKEYGLELIRTEREKMQYNSQWGLSYSTNFSMEKIQALKKAYKI